jgi:hypothetical protein
VFKGRARPVYSESGVHSCSSVRFVFDEHVAHINAEVERLKGGTDWVSHIHNDLRFILEGAPAEDLSYALDFGLGSTVQ